MQQVFRSYQLQKEEFPMGVLQQQISNMAADDAFLDHDR
jgi:hypothetical protein